ncbi:Uncharacterized conserved protein YggE, contains kinase-interacting SIMPL domain [Sphingomonas gellani]|uniref:Uncharacterized conserved protein YggE, contains kinase-interacting SIMPL domain n=2 Tax=Sphingomonas gellani TaxID=1166340 RepID=A0A1H8BG32_9SPHN|nr:Uncharacterized conserved protein YggE, contains kinase-interacting SIMPL domain [Sphingomonas gellani]
MLVFAVQEKPFTSDKSDAFYASKTGASMRAGLLPVLGAALIAPTPLFAQSASPVVLAPGEVLAQSAGTGLVRSRPEIALFRLTVTGRADDAGAARAACEAALHDLRTKLRSVGVPDAAVTVLPAQTAQIGFIGNEAYSDDDAPNPAAAAPLMAMDKQRKVVTVGVQIELTDMSRLASVRQLLMGRDDVVAQPPTLSLRDDTAARRSAIAQAIAKAKAEADAYSVPLGLRVSRIIRVFDPAATSEQPQVWSQMTAIMNGSNGNEVITDARVGMDVVLAPR